MTARTLLVSNVLVYGFGGRLAFAPFNEAHSAAAARSRPACRGACRARRPPGERPLSEGIGT